MNILELLRGEAEKLEQQLNSINGAIKALGGGKARGNGILLQRAGSAFPWRLRRGGARSRLQSNVNYVQGLGCWSKHAI